MRRITVRDYLLAKALPREAWGRVDYQGGQPVQPQDPTPDPVAEARRREAQARDLMMAGQIAAVAYHTFQQEQLVPTLALDQRWRMYLGALQTAHAHGRPTPPVPPDLMPAYRAAAAKVRVELKAMLAMFPPSEGEA